MTSSMQQKWRSVFAVAEAERFDDAKSGKAFEHEQNGLTVSKAVGNVLLAVVAARQFDVVGRRLRPELLVGQFLKPLLNILTVFESMHANSMPERPAFAQI